MDLKTFYQRLDGPDRKRFAERAGTSTGYIEVHLLPRRKIPRPALVNGLVAACASFNAPITREGILSFFYPTAEPEKSATS
jgi:hypothetical protein